jgi:hypothetical protein
MQYVIFYGITIKEEIQILLYNIIINKLFNKTRLLKIIIDFFIINDKKNNEFTLFYSSVKGVENWGKLSVN